MKKFSALLLAAVLVLMCAGCGKEPVYLSGEVADSAVIRIGMTEEPATLDPALYDATLAEAAILGQLYEGLTVIDEEGKTVSGAAESWSISATKDAAKRPIYTFNLDDSACWSDGTPVKAEDFVFAWKRIISGEVDSPYRYLFDIIHGASSYKDESSELGLSVSEHGELVVTLEGEFAAFPRLVASVAFSPLREDVVTKDAGWYFGAAPTNGVYTASRWDRGDSIQLTQNEHHRAAEEVNGLTLEYLFRDADALRTAAEENTIQATFGYAGDDASVVIGENSTVHYIAFNTEKVTAAGVRAAMARVAQNPEESVLLGVEVEPLTFLVFEGLSAGDDETDGVRENRVMAEQLAAMWQEKLGLKVTVDCKDYAGYKAARDAGEYDLIYCGSAADYNDMAAYLGFFVTDAAGNYANYSNEDYDTLLNDARTEHDETARLALLEQARTLLVETDAVVIPVSRGNAALQCNPRLIGITCDEMGFWNFSNAFYSN